MSKNENEKKIINNNESSNVSFKNYYKDYIQSNDY